MNYPILMADIINSGKKDSRLLMSQLRDIVTAINNKGKVVSPLTITLGDEFQGITSSIPDGIKTILNIEELIITNQFDLKLRYVLNYGKIDTKINTKTAYEMLGRGLTEARKSLNELKNEDSRFLISLGDNMKDTAEIINQAFIIYQSFVDSWKINDYPIVAEFFKTNDYKVVAEKVNLDRSSAWRRRKSLKMHEYETIKNIIVTLLKPLL
ncbi:MAG: SatD family protein [Daejeonella sp.]|uniref:SatD family protein n=1 Tax=Daejeonella sp. JGW-45 TaxID=3034148 RepID=UPI0023EB2A82|nr:SatD family protein [Daejeonella sp. JGW-45]